MAMLLSNPTWIPEIAVPMSVTATIPMITPSAVSVERVLFERICATAIFQLSLSSYRKRFISKPRHPLAGDLRPANLPCYRIHPRHFQSVHHATGRCAAHDSRYLLRG